MMRTFFDRIIVKAVILVTLFLGIANVSAQEANSVVAFEGTVSYKSNGTVSRLQTSGTADKLGNFSYDQEFYGTRVILVFSNSPFRSGKNVRGPAGARSGTISTLQPRTYYTNISYSGTVRLQRGKRYAAVLLAIDGQNRILAAHNFSRGLTTRSVKKGVGGAVHLKKTSGKELYIAE